MANGNRTELLYYIVFFSFYTIKHVFFQLIYMLFKKKQFPLNFSFQISGRITVLLKNKIIDLVLGTENSVCKLSRPLTVRSDPYVNPIVEKTGKTNDKTQHDKKHNMPKRVGPLFEKKNKKQ